jgi:hypothetical protein
MLVSGALLLYLNMLASQLAAQVLRLAQLWQNFQQVRLSIDRLGDILNTVPDPGGAARLSFGSTAHSEILLSSCADWSTPATGASISPRGTMCVSFQRHPQGSSRPCRAAGRGTLSETVIAEVHSGPARQQWVLL